MANAKKKLLLVDDDFHQLATRKAILELVGYAVLTAADARHGLQLLESEMPDAVVLDYEMPTVKGDMLAGKIRRINDAIPIVMLSGCPSVPRSVLIAVDRFVPKATGPSLLVDAIESLLGRQEVFA